MIHPYPSYNHVEILLWNRSGSDAILNLILIYDMYELVQLIYIC